MALKRIKKVCARLAVLLAGRLLVRVLCWDAERAAVRTREVSTTEQVADCIVASSSINRN